MMIKLPEPISANVYWRHRRGQFKPYPNPVADAYKLQVRVALNAANVPLIFQPVRVTVYYAASTVRRDTDNALKVLFDACQGIWYVNDNQIRSLVIERCEAPAPKRENACVLMKVEPLASTHQDMVRGWIFGDKEP